MMIPDENRAWERLVRAARAARADEAVSMPYGFATRVVARAFAQEPVSISALFSRLSLRALLVASVLAIASLALNYPAIAAGTTDVEASLDDDPVALILDLS